MVVADQLEPAEEALVEALVDHRAVEHVLRRLAHGRLLDRPREARHELVVHRLVDDHRAERGAALAGGAEAAEQRPLDGQVEVGVGHHDERVLAAELEARATAGGGRTARRSGARRPTEPVKPTLSTSALVERPLEALERGRPVGLHEVQHALGQRRRGGTAG